jgi:hypothetical protein
MFQYKLNYLTYTYTYLPNVITHDSPYINIRLDIYIYIYIYITRFDNTLYSNIEDVKRYI